MVSGGLGKVWTRWGAEGRDRCSASAAPLGASAVGRKSPNHRARETGQRGARTRSIPDLGFNMSVPPPSHAKRVNPRYLPSAPRVRSSSGYAAPHALPASVIPSQSMPSHAHPESSSRSTPTPTKTLHGLSPTGREGETEAQESLAASR